MRNLRKATITTLQAMTIGKKEDSSYKHVFTGRVENSVDPDQLASQKPADLDLHCFQNRQYLGSV